MSKTSKRQLATMGWLISLLLLTSCHDDVTNGEVEKGQYTEIAISRAQKDIVASSNDFAFDFLKSANEGIEANENIALSPYSCFAAFSMLANGAAVEAQQEIIEVLTGSSSLDIESLNDLNKTLLAELPIVDNATTFKTANSIWVRDIVTPKQPYVDVLRNVYDSKVYNFGNDMAAATNAINKWCSEKTNGKIPQYYTEPLNGNAMMILLNATYYKGIWSDRFDKKNTIVDTFNGINTVSSAPMMKREATYTYGEGESEQIVKIPYGSGNYNMYVILPKENVDINDYLSTLDYDKVASVQNQMSSQLVKLSMPRFDITTKVELNDILKAMGMKHVFGYTMPGIFDNSDLVLSKSDTEVTISVDEEGTVAAAVTSGEVWCTSPGPMPVEKVTMTIDRPFIFYIQENSTGTIVFMGKISQL